LPLSGKPNGSSRPLPHHRIASPSESPILPSPPLRTPAPPKAASCRSIFFAPQRLTLLLAQLFLFHQTFLNKSRVNPFPGARGLSQTVFGLKTNGTALWHVTAATDNVEEKISVFATCLSNSREAVRSPTCRTIPSSPPQSLPPSSAARILYQVFSTRWTTMVSTLFRPIDPAAGFLPSASSWCCRPVRQFNASAKAPHRIRRRQSRSSANSGPTVTGSVLAGPALGAGIASELGSLLVTEQVDAHARPWAPIPAATLFRRAPRRHSHAATLHWSFFFFFLRLRRTARRLRTSYLLFVLSAVEFGRAPSPPSNSAISCNVLEAARLGFSLATVVCYKGLTGSRWHQCFGRATTSRRHLERPH